MYLDSEIDASGIPHSGSIYITGSTGSLNVDTYKIITRHFGQYEIKLKVSLDTRSVEVIEVKINKDFLSHNQKLASIKYYDAEDYVTP